MENEHQKELSRILGIENKEKPASWAEIYIEIGRLIQRAEVKPELPNFPVEPLTPPIGNLHYHNGTPCYNNPCVYCKS